MTLNDLLYTWHARNKTVIHAVIRNKLRGKYMEPFQLVISLARDNPALFKFVETLTLPGDNALGVSRCIYPPLERINK